ncbi:MAG: hypothetical protein QY323_01870 [Patescibacteria group bacterium]|nr:MAG: hypothetical protein QY323_01870 [Patescibacteria group bacterium]
MDMKKAALAALGLAVGFVAGYGTGRVSTGTPINPLSGGKGGYEEGYAAAAKLIADSGVFPPAPTELSSLSGVVVAVEGPSVAFDANLTTLNPLVQLEGPKRRVVLLTADTKIVRMEEQSPEDFALSLENFNATVAAGEPSPPPQLAKEVPYTSPLKAGDMITVAAATNILSSEMFEATTIIVSPAP